MNSKILEPIDQNWLNSLLNIKSVKHLCLRGCKLNDFDAIEISKIIEKSSTIISLNLFGNCITDEGGKAIAKALRTNQFLQSLSLSMNLITDETVIELCESLKPKITEDEEEYNIIREKVFNFYGMKPPKRKQKLSIQALNEWENSVEITKATKKNPISTFKIPGNNHLKNINLSINQITDDGAKCFIDALKFNTSVFRISLSNTKVTEEILIEIGKALTTSRETTNVRPKSRKSNK